MISAVAGARGSDIVCLRESETPQTALVVEGALSRAFDPQFAQFFLINCAGWRSRHELTGANGRDLFLAEQQSDLETARRMYFLMDMARQRLEEEKGDGFSEGTVPP